MAKWGVRLCWNSLLFLGNRECCLNLFMIPEFVTKKLFTCYSVPVKKSIQSGEKIKMCNYLTHAAKKKFNGVKEVY